MGQGAVLELGDDLFDDGVPPVGQVGLDRVEVAVGDERVVAPGREQLALDRAVGGQRLQAADPAHHEPAGHVLVLAAAGERHVRDLGDLGVADPASEGLVEDGLGVADRGPAVLGDAADRGLDLGVHPGGHREPRPVPHGGPDERSPVVRGVGTGKDLTAGPGGSGGREAWARRRPAPGRRGDVPRRSLARAITGAAVGVERVASWTFRPRRGCTRTRRPASRSRGPPDGVVDIDERELLGAGEQARDPPGESGQHRSAGGVELLDVAVGEASAGTSPTSRAPNPSKSRRTAGPRRPAVERGARRDPRHTALSRPGSAPARSTPAGRIETGRGQPQRRRPRGHTRFGSSNTARTV